MKTLTNLGAAALVAGTLVTPAVAHNQGDLILRAGIAHVMPNDDSSATSGAVVLPKDSVGVEDGTSLGLTGTYMVTDNIGIGLLVAWPFEHDLEGQGAISALGTIGEVTHLPPTLTVQYHFDTGSNIHPYIGAGINYTAFFSEDASSSLETALGGKTDIDLDNSWGLAAEVGVDVEVGNGWMVNASAWYIDIDTEATLTTAGVGKTKFDVDIDPWVVMLGVGKRF